MAANASGLKITIIICIQGKNVWDFWMHELGKYIMK
jgi:hypothetical protein